MRRKKKIWLSIVVVLFFAFHWVRGDFMVRREVRVYDYDNDRDIRHPVDPAYMVSKNCILGRKGLGEKMLICGYLEEPRTRMALDPADVLEEEKHPEREQTLTVNFDHTWPFTDPKGQSYWVCSTRTFEDPIKCYYQRKVPVGPTWFDPLVPETPPQDSKKLEKQPSERR